MLEFHLIDSSYSKQESFELLYELLDAKITLLGKKIHSNSERGVSSVHFESRREKLLETRDRLKELMTAFDEGELSISCKVTVQS